MDRSSTSLKLLTILVLLYGGLLIYASLMPYNFTSSVDLSQLFHVRIWNYWPFNPWARFSGSDFLSNLVLYVPLGFLLATRLCFTRIGRLMSFGLTALVCSCLSAGIETLQGLTISRIPSATDWVLNSVSGLLGAGVGVAQGRPLWGRTTSWLKDRWHSHPLDIVTLSYMVLLTADALSPFLPTILLSQVWRNLENSHFGIAEGLAQHPWHWWLITRALMYLILTFLLAAWGGTGHRRRAWGKAMFLAMFFSLGLELMKPMIDSRVINVANIVIAAAGAALAAGMGSLCADRLSRRRKLDLAILALLGYECYLAWTPFNFIWALEPALRKLPSAVELLPLYHYAMGASLNHVRLFVQAIVLQGILIYLLRMRFFRFDQCQARLALAVLLAAVLGLILEGGQLFLPSRTPAMTDVYCFMIGAACGALLPRMHHRTEEHP